MCKAQVHPPHSSKHRVYDDLDHQGSDYDSDKDIEYVQPSNSESSEDDSESDPFPVLNHQAGRGHAS